MDKPISQPIIPVDLLHTVVCSLMTQFIHRRCPVIATAIARYLKQLSKHPDQHLLRTTSNEYAELAAQWESLAQRLSSTWAAPKHLCVTH